MSNDLWFRGMDIKEEGEKRKNSKDTRAHLEAMVLRTKPEANQWLHLTPRVAALGADAFEQGPVMIRKIHAYLVKEVNLAENAAEKAAKIVNRVCQVTLETFCTQKVKGEEGFERAGRAEIRMDRVLLGESLPKTLSIFDKRVPPSSSGSINRQNTSLVRDVWSRKLRKRTGCAAQRGNSELAVRWTSDIDCDNTWKLGRNNELDTLPRADERECEEVPSEESHGFLQ